MQFTASGPDIPDALIEAHEEGRVVFFCGAGISYPADLPDFRGLVDAIYRLVGTAPNDIEREAYDRYQYDAMLDLLERRLPGQRIAVRAALATALKPNLRRKGATDTHAALLELARTRQGPLRLVTTNFDRIFEVVAKRLKLKAAIYTAPMLPVPKNSRWDGLVHLHGLLPEKSDENALHRLVVTSGDFGLAYLTERWAARFVSELFRNYVVCFIGYSINDPVLRYMMDALAADRMLGEVTPQAYALGDCCPGQEPQKVIEWRAKGVTPILYEVPAGTQNHSALHRTLRTWAETFRDGILGKERIVVNHALATPSASTRQDDFVGRVLWALSDHSGLPAKRFAEFDPAPALAWLEAFSEDRLGHADLSRFGVSPGRTVDSKLHFSMVRRPAFYTHAPWMSLASWGPADTEWDLVMVHLARWLMRHLNDPTLVIWLGHRGGHLHPRWAFMIDIELDRQARLEKEGRAAELNVIRKNAPNAIPSALMRVAWRLLLTGRVKMSSRDLGLLHWVDRFKRDGLTPTLRVQLRELLAPQVTMTEPFRLRASGDATKEPKRLRDLFAFELALASDHVGVTVRDLAREERWLEALPALQGDLQQLLVDALDLLREIGEADDRSDRVHWDLPSIIPHRQNRGFRDWAVLIELLRDSWIETRRRDPPLATRLARTWFDLRYPTFKRLALFAASHDDCITPGQWVSWLLMDHAWWLWSVETRRETMRLLVLQGSRLTGEARSNLESAILAGPPREMFVPELDPKEWRSLVERAVWLHLAKLRCSGGKLGDTAADRLNELSAAHPEWGLAKNESDEFSHWVSGTGDPDFQMRRTIDTAPRQRKQLVAWLKKPPPSDAFFYQDTWRDTCRSRFFLSLFALCDLAREEVWPAARWGEALQAWSEESKVRRSWRFAAPLVRTMPSGTIQEIVHAVTWWLESASKSLDTHEPDLLDLCRRVLELPFQDAGETERPVTSAINHPVGHVTQALLNAWFKRGPNDNDKLPRDIEPLFTKLCDPVISHFRHARVLLAANLIPLFRVDRTWTEANLLPLFEWASDPVEAKAAWEGFLWSPRLYWPLLTSIRLPFIEAASHYAALGEHRRQYAAFLTYAALDPAATFAPNEFRAAMSALPPEGLQDAAEALWQALEGAGDQREDYWKNRVRPLWHAIWPKSRDLTSDAMSDALARLSIAARGEFPNALATVLCWLRPMEHPDLVVHLLKESGLAGRFPQDALGFLDAVLQEQPWVPRDLEACLDAISRASPLLEQDHRYQRLRDYSRR